MKTNFPSLSKSHTYTYDASSVCSQNAAEELKHYYNFNKKTKTIEFPELTKEHFAENLYKNVVEGSLRWWLLELRKFDYNLIAREGLVSGDTITLTKIMKHQTAWIKKIEDWFVKYTKGLNNDTTTSVGEATSQSKYILNTKSNNDKELTISEAVAIGKNENGEPLFYKFVKDADGNEDIKCGVRLQDLKNIKNTKEFTEKWWLLERMRYDYGDSLHPVAAEFGMLSGDWKGVEYKFNNGLHNISDTDIISYHERGWIQWVNFRCNNRYNPVAPINTYRHNMATIARLNADQLNEIASICPDYIIDHMPPKFYADVINHILNTINGEGRFGFNDKKSISSISTLLKKIKVYNTTPSGCSNINLSNVITAISTIDPHGSLIIAQILVSKAIQYNMITGNNANLLSNLIISLTPKDPIRKANYNSFDNYCERNSIEPIDFWSAGSHHLTNLFAEIEKPVEEVKRKYNLK